MLGEWCRLYLKEESNSLPIDVLPYHWDDRKRLATDFARLEILQDEIITHLHPALNTIHRTNHSLRFWKILVGPWLLHFLAIAFDRFTSIQQAMAANKDLRTLVPALAEGEMTPNDITDFIERFISDPYNQYLYGRIVRFNRDLPFEEVAPISRDKKKAPVSTKGSLKNRIKALGTAPARFLPASWNSVVFVASAFPKEKLARLQFALGQVPALDTYPVPVPTFSYSCKLRESLAQAWAFSAKDNFERFIQEILPEQIPLVHLEGFTELKKIAASAFPSCPKVILSATAHVDHEPFKVWAATNIEKGARLAVIQHGGHHGTGWCSVENHELQVADRYFSWGWSGDKKIKALPSPKLLRAKPTTPNAAGPLLLILNSFPRYSYRLYSIPIACQALRFLEDQALFIRSLSREACALLEVRLYHSDYGWKDGERLRDQFPDLNLSQSGLSLAKHMAQSRLFIGTHNTTTHLEGLSRNFPTVLYWNPEHWELRSAAQPFFDSLREVGILHDSPEEAAEHINAIYSKPLTWWSQEKVQAVREKFCRQFARNDREWCRIWKREIKDLADV